MTIWKQLRWRVVGAHLTVVVVGVIVLALMFETVILRKLSTDVQSYLLLLTEGANSKQIEQVTISLLSTFRQSTLYALGVAAVGAAIAGLLTSIFLLREILQPLSQITQSSQRIASGRYSERVTIPELNELAQVATNFNQMAEALEHIEQERVTLIANVSHEFRTPLTGLEGYLEGLVDGVFPKNEETFMLMSQEVRRLHRLVNDLQALSRVEAGQISLHLSDFDLLALLKRVINQLEPQAEVQGLSLLAEYPPSDIVVEADPDRTTQVIINLIDNAIRYTPTGGQIKILVSTNNKQVEVKIQDTGIGISPESLPHIFERFYRTDQSRSRKSGGSGIGLTISRHLAWAMGGDINVDSEGLGKGSVFYFTLPLRQN